MAEIDTTQFSYQPVFVRLPSDDIGRTPSPLELKDRKLLTDEERVELAALFAEDEKMRRVVDEERRRLELEREHDEGLIEG